VGLRVDTWPLSNSSAEETSGPPRFLVDPDMLAPRSSTPVGHRTWLSGNGDAAFRSYDDVGPTMKFPFEAQSRSSSTPCVTLHARVTPTRANTWFRLVAIPLPGGVGYLLGLTRGFNYIASSSSRLRLAHRTRESRAGAQLRTANLGHNISNRQPRARGLGLSS